MSELIAFFIGWFAMMFLWYKTEYKVYTAVYHRGYRKGQADANCPEIPDSSDAISRQDAIEAINSWLYCDKDERMPADVIKALPSVQTTITHEQAIDYLHETGWLQNHDRILTESKIVPPVQLKNGTLIIPLNESDFKSVKRIILDNKPWCRTFYEDVPGEAHWIKSYTPDDGEIYECDNCGVTWQFNDGGPEENEAFYCPKCGFKMVPKEGEADE